MPNSNVDKMSRMTGMRRVEEPVMRDAGNEAINDDHLNANTFTRAGTSTRSEGRKQ